MYWPNIRQDQETLWIEDATTLLTWNRFDLAIKLAYLSNINYPTSAALLAYKDHIRAFTLGSFIEPGNPGKDSIDRYLEEFSSTHKSIKRDGFDANISLVPLASDGSIINGAHRVSSAISQNKSVSAVRLPIKPDVYDWRFFYQKGLSTPSLDLAATEFVRHSKNTYMALLWPRSAAHHANMALLFDQAVYDKTVRLSAQGTHNLLCACYRGESWLGAEEQNFPGVKGKLKEVFSEDLPLRVVAFQAPNLEAVSALKERIRAQAGLGKHSIHVTDSMQESVEMASLLLNDNAIHFLNFSHPNKFRSLPKKLQKVRDFLHDNGISEMNAVVDSSLLLELYGIRRANDIDMLLADSIRPGHVNNGIQCHDSELVHHERSKHELIYDPSHHFFYKGIKFIGFTQLYKFKKNRSDRKDAADVSAMSGMTGRHRSLAGRISVVRSELLFQHAKFSANLIRSAKRFRIYVLLRRAKHKLLGRF